MSNNREELVRLLRETPYSPVIPKLVSEVEDNYPADLSCDSDLLYGVWGLRWSSSTQPWLRQAPWLENLQILDSVTKRGGNVLRLRGPLGAVGGVFVQVDLNVINSTRVEVCFRRGGWLGPRLFGIGQIKLLRDVRQSFPAWLDMTVLDAQLRICRGNAGTTFALLRDSDLNVADFLG
ncbi:plastid lipid-associated protein (PAP)/fibrillin family [Synechococcus sp. RS9915]|nr:plastid lipid-associated protein (PAP)/fibrillin family [Synechococcus sp. RS9915]